MGVGAAARGSPGVHVVQDAPGFRDDALPPLFSLAPAAGSGLVSEGQTLTRGSRLCSTRAVLAYTGRPHNHSEQARVTPAAARLCPPVEVCAG